MARKSETSSTPKAISPASYMPKSDIASKENHHAQQQAYSPSRDYRYGCYRRELDGAVSGEGSGGGCDRCRTECRGRAETFRRDRLVGAQKAGSRACCFTIEADVYGGPCDSCKWRGPCPGEWARANRFQEEALPGARWALAT